MCQNSHFSFSANIEVQYLQIEISMTGEVKKF